MAKRVASSGAEMKYEEALKEAQGDSSVLSIRGRLVSRPGQQLTGPRGCIPILWCLCVHDSPDNPCPCTGPIVWFPEKEIRFRRVPHEQDSGQVELQLKSDVRVYLEDSREIGGKNSDARLMRLNADGIAEAVPETLWVQEFTAMRVGPLHKALQYIEKNPQLTAIAKKKGKGFWAKIVAAFEAGWAIGEFIDEETGLSDKISDWMLDTFGPWPW